MCTALTLLTKECEVLFGRNLDLEYNFGQSVHLVPRNYKWINIVTDKIEDTKYAILSMGVVVDRQPFLLDGFNEVGLGCAALNFPGYAYFNREIQEDKINLAPYDIVLWILSNFKTIEDVEYAFKDVNIVRSPRVANFPQAIFHWIVADRSGRSIVIEKTKEKLSIYQNKIGVLTNSPPFDWQTTNMRQYIPLSPYQPKDVYWCEQKLTPVGNGIGTLGMPGDYSPPSRFIRIAFAKTNMSLPEDEDRGISEFYHMLNNVAAVNGSVITRTCEKETTLYSSCMNLQKGIYYYNTYYNNRINAIIMWNENLNAKDIKTFPYLNKLDINYEN